MCYIISLWKCVGGASLNDNERNEITYASHCQLGNESITAKNQQERVSPVTDASALLVCMSPMMYLLVTTY
jgi:hypothetical protein